MAVAMWIAILRIRIEKLRTEDAFTMADPINPIRNLPVLESAEPNVNLT